MATIKSCMWNITFEKLSHEKKPTYDDVCYRGPLYSILIIGQLTPMLKAERESAVPCVSKAETARGRKNFKNNNKKKKLYDCSRGWGIKTALYHVFGERFKNSPSGSQQLLNNDSSRVAFAYSKPKNPVNFGALTARGQSVECRWNPMWCIRNNDGNLDCRNYIQNNGVTHDVIISRRNVNTLNNHFGFDKPTVHTKRVVCECDVTLKNFPDEVRYNNISSFIFYLILCFTKKEKRKGKKKNRIYTEFIRFIVCFDVLKIVFVLCYSIY